MFTGPVRLAKQPEWIPDCVVWIWLTVLVLYGLVYVYFWMQEMNLTNEQKKEILDSESFES